MGDYRIEAYKRSVKRITAKYGKEIDRISAELAEVDEELKELEQIEEQSSDDKKKIADLQKQRGVLRKRIDTCIANLQINLRVIEPSPDAPKKELAELPGWLKTVIQNEGIPLGGASIAPDIDIDVKAKTLEKFGINITVKW